MDDSYFAKDIDFEMDISKITDNKDLEEMKELIAKNDSYEQVKRNKINQ